MSHIPHLLRQHETALRKTASYYAIHIVVAATVAYAVTGDWLAAMALSLLEPTIQALAYFLHDKAWTKMPAMRLRTLAKTLSYYVLHLAVAASVAYAITGDLLAALTLSLLEPTVQMAFYFLHETLWERKTRRPTSARLPVCTSAASCLHASRCTSQCTMAST